MVVDAAYARCLALARGHYENFPVASRMLPRAMRPHVAAVYAFARIADDFADEGRRTAEERLALAKPDVLVMHPGPINRGVEIDSRVADGPHSVILEQVTNGIAVRMAIMSITLGNHARPAGESL